MQLFERIFGIDDQSESGIQLNPGLRASLEEAASQEQKPVAEFIEELLYFALEEHITSADKLNVWHELTNREQETAALACLGYTNREIAQRMVISTNTVKTHIRSVLTKFNLNSKADLRANLANWDFNAWLEAQYGPLIENPSLTSPDSPK
ncbi:MAG: helix-turn-helix transcriptional regulator [Candidatus Promineifilaceae bacterium]